MKTIISLIAAMDEANGLGINNQLLCHLPADLQHFKSITMCKPIIMGRKTFASIGKPLPGRLNIVLSRNSSTIGEVLVVDSLEEAIRETSEYPEI
ncbi:MAG: dihydrofolate reductase, partial [Legionella longbeachae]|nr:dihydrofolate reductase [Legionella longbeachae]